MSKQPFERAVENEGQKKKLSQSKLGFEKKKPESDDDSDDDDDDLGCFNFSKHKASSAPEKKSAISKMHEDEGEKKKKKEETRTLLQSKWPRSKAALPDGWSAKQYRFDRKKDKEAWVFFHPKYGETENKEHTRRTDDEWMEALSKKRGGGSSSKAAPAPADDAPSSQEDDPLAALLNGKRKREEEDEAIREQVHEEMSLRMDTGVRVNQSLKKSLLG